LAQLPGLIINGIRIKNSRFADDVFILAKGQEQFKEMLEELKIQSRKGGARDEYGKTKIIGKQDNKSNKKLKSTEIKTHETATYLGQQISLEAEMEKEINKYKNNEKVGKILVPERYIEKPLQPSSQKPSIMCVIPSLTYGCQTWSLTEKHINKLKTIQNAMERTVSNIKKKKG